jgi:Helix-turn-helix domain
MKTESSPVPMLLRPTEAARMLGVHPQSLANWRAAGRGPKWCKLGTAVRYSVEALREYYEANTRTPGAAR